MAAGRKQQQQQQGVVVAEPSVARRMWRVLRAVLYMLRRGLPSGRKLAMDLHLLLHRGKIAGKALGDLLTSHGHHHTGGGFSSSSYAVDGAAGSSSSFSCRALDPSLAVHEPSSRNMVHRCREVEFSCSNTPSSAADVGVGGLGLLGKRGRRSRRRGGSNRDDGYLHLYNYDAADVARVFEMLGVDDGLSFFGDAEQQQPYATPSPARLLWTFGRSPAVTSSSRKPRVVAESPASSSDDGGAQVDLKADEFIRRFYEQLRAQRSAASTPDYYYGSSSRRTPRAIAAGTA